MLPTTSRAAAALLAGCLLVAANTASADTGSRDGADSGAAAPDGQHSDGSVRLDPRRAPRNGGIGDNFVGLSIEWSLIERYMGPAARPAFANLLANLDTGVLRIGGSSQDQTKFEADAPNTNRVITRQDLADIRATLDLTNGGDSAGQDPSWGVALGTAMAPPSVTRPWISPEHAKDFVTNGVVPEFSGAASRYVVGVELGNEPDLTFRRNLDHYLSELAKYTDADVTAPFAAIAPNTSEPIRPWQGIASRQEPDIRFFWDWPQILDTFEGAIKAHPGALGNYTSDHFYPLARTCPSDEYRCPTITRLLSDERLDNFRYQVFTHASEAARHGLGYRLEELNTAAGRGASGVSDVAASAVWALDSMFNAACPQSPEDPTANRRCRVSATGVNFHNAEVRAFYFPEEGNAYYNAINYDPTAAMGSPTAAPEYYAMLFFSHLAQGTSGLRPVSVEADTPAADQVKAWRVDDARSERRLIMVNKSAEPTTLTVKSPSSTYELNRMTPYDPTGAGRTLDAPGMQIDGHQVAADGTWPGFAPTVGKIRNGALQVTLGAGETVAITLRGHR